METGLWAGGEALRCVSVDVEEYFHVEAARGVAPAATWGDWPSRVEGCVARVLGLLERCGRRGTFFVLGHVAERRPGVVRAIAAAGHEVASHGSMHDRLHRLTPASFRADLLASKGRLEDLAGRAVVGYRAPTFSITRQTAWAIDVLADCGFRYDSSIFPVRHPWYGVAEAPVRPFWCKVQSAKCKVAEGAASRQSGAGQEGAPSRQGGAGRGGGGVMLEVPPLVWRVAGRNLAVAGGGYFRLLPLALMKRGLRQAERQGRPAVLYFHPWEFDPDMPRMPLSLTGRIRTYTGLATAERKLEGILRQPARWTPIVEALAELEALADQGGAFTLGDV